MTLKVLDILSKSLSQRDHMAITGRLSRIVNNIFPYSQYCSSILSRLFNHNYF